MSRFIDPRPQYRPNSKLFFFDSGTNTQKVTYKDQFETIENTHPVLTDSAGVVPNIFFSGSAKLILQDENSVQYGEYDPVGGQKELGNFTPWDIVVTYDKNNITEGSDGEFYVSLSNGNVGNDPTDNPGDNEFWECWPVNGIYNAKILYAIADVVQSTLGNFWKSLTVDNIGNDPEADDGTNWANAINTQWINKSAAFNVIAGKSYQIDASGGSVDAALAVSYGVGDVIIVHNESISTNTVRLTNTALTLKGINDVITPSDNLTISAGDTAHIVMKTATIGEFV